MLELESFELIMLEVMLKSKVRDFLREGDAYNAEQYNIILVKIKKAREIQK